MAKKIILAQLALDEKAFLAAAKNTQKAILELAKTQKLLKKNGKENSEQFIKNEITLKKLRGEYLQQKKAIIALESPYAKLANRLIRARKEFKDLAATQGISNKRLTEARTKVIALDRQLKRIDKSVGQHQRNIGNYGGALKGLTASFLGLTAVIFGAIRAVKNAIGIFTSFEKQNATLSAILQVEKEDMEALQEEAKRLGAITAKTATEVVGLQIAFARLGFTQQEIIDLTEATISGSIAMNAELAATANLVGAMVNSFDDFSAIDAPEIIDVLALSTAKSALNFEKLEKGLPIVAGAANAAGISFTKLIALMGKLSDAGIDVSTSSTALRNIFIEAAGRGEDYSEIIERIKNSQDKLTTSFDAFGKRAAVSAAVLAQNIDATLELDDALNEAAGTAQRMADKELDTLIGKMTLLKSAWQGLVLSIEDGDGALAKFFSNAITGTTKFITLIQSIGEVSTGFFDFFINLQKSAQLGGAGLIVLDAQIKRIQKERIRLAKQLVDLIDEEQRGLGFIIDKNRELDTQLNKTTDQIKEYITEINNRKKAVEDAAAADEQLLIDNENKKKKLTKEQREQAKRDLAKFEQEKIDLLNEIEVAQAETDREKAEIKSEQRKEKELAELEELLISRAAKDELIELIEEAHLERLFDIRDIAREKERVAKEKAEKDRKKTADKNRKLIEKNQKQEVKADELIAQQKIVIAQRFGNFLNNILGENLASAIIAAVTNSLVQIGRIQASTATAQAANLAAATAISVADPTALIRAKARNITLGIFSKISQGIVIASNVARLASGFYEGGRVPTETGGRISGQNIPSRRGGDNIVATVKSGEVILNDQQQQRAGGDAFFKSIGVPGFQDGGIAGIPSTTLPTQSILNTEEFAEILADRINDIKIVAIEEEISEAIATKVEIVDGANI